MLVSASIGPISPSKSGPRIHILLGFSKVLIIFLRRSLHIPLSSPFPCQFSYNNSHSWEWLQYQSMYERKKWLWKLTNKSERPVGCTDASKIWSSFVIYVLDVLLHIHVVEGIGKEIVVMHINHYILEAPSKWEKHSWIWHGLFESASSQHHKPPGNTSWGSPDSPPAAHSSALFLPDLLCSHTCHQTQLPSTQSVSNSNRLGKTKELKFKPCC